MGKKVLITGVSGFIGHHMARFLNHLGYQVRGVSRTPSKWLHKNELEEFVQADLTDKTQCIEVMKDIEEVYNFAADMGGIGYIDKNPATIMSTNAVININILEAAIHQKVKRVYFSSSACVYSDEITTTPDSSPITESQAYPANPANEYGWEKIFAERLYLSYMSQYGLDIKIGRLHTIYGEECEFDSGKEKAPAAICRKVSMSNDADTIEIWGDGKQTRTFLYISDAVRAIHLLMRSNYHGPMNIGSNELISINKLVELLAQIADKKIEIKHDLSKPQGVRGRGTDISLIENSLLWKQEISLTDGFTRTYNWINAQVHGK